MDSRPVMLAGLRTLDARDTRAGADVPRSTQLLDEIDERIGISAKDIAIIVGEVRDLADRVFGSQPENTTGSAKTPSGGGRAADLREKMSWLQETIVSLRIQLGRLHSSL